MKVVICPICGGSGQIQTSYGVIRDVTGCYPICHGCGGKGWVEVGEETKTYLPPDYSPYTPPYTTG